MLDSLVIDTASASLNNIAYDHIYSIDADVEYFTDKHPACRWPVSPNAQTLE